MKDIDRQCIDSAKAEEPTYKTSLICGCVLPAILGMAVVVVLVWFAVLI